MSFSAAWLALREPVDHRSRNRDLLGALAHRFVGRETIAVVDLGCGAGSNLRAVAPSLPPGQTWRLVDYDPALLAAARERLAAWAEDAETLGSDLRLRRGGKVLTAAFLQADLAADPERPLGDGPDLVTAAALFDLVSPAWIGRFAKAVAAHRAVFYTALTYDGVESWRPPHPADAAMLAAFHAHQAGDKGFGPSAGPKATEILTESFLAAGYRVRTGDSPWRLAGGDAALIRDLAEGAAQAVRETGQVREADIARWLEARREAEACTIGHTDLLAFPPA